MKKESALTLLTLFSAGSAACAPPEEEIDPSCFPEDALEVEMQGVPVRVPARMLDSVKAHLQDITDTVGYGVIANNVDSIHFFDALKPGCNIPSQAKGWVENSPEGSLPRIYVNIGQRTVLQPHPARERAPAMPLAYNGSGTIYEPGIDETVNRLLAQQFWNAGLFGTRTEGEELGIYDSSCEVLWQKGQPASQWPNPAGSDPSKCERVVPLEADPRDQTSEDEQVQKAAIVDFWTNLMTVARAVRSNLGVSNTYSAVYCPAVREDPARLGEIRVALEGRKSNGFSFPITPLGDSYLASGMELFNARVRYFAQEGLLPTGFTEEELRFEPLVNEELRELYDKQTANSLAALGTCYAKGTLN